MLISTRKYEYPKKLYSLSNFFTKTYFWGRKKVISVVMILQNMLRKIKLEIGVLPRRLENEHRAFNRYSSRTFNNYW